MNRADIIRVLANAGGVEQKSARAMLDAFERLLIDSLSEGGSGEFRMPGLFKVKAVPIDARAAFERTNPFGGGKMHIPARPPGMKIKIQPLNRLKNIGRGA